MQKLKEKLYASPSFSKCKVPAIPGSEIRVTGLKGSLRAFFLSYLVEIHKKKIIYITSDGDSAERLRDDLEIIIGKKMVGFLPAAEISPYEERDPNPSLIRLRLESIQQMIEYQDGIIVALLNGIMSKIPTPEKFIDHQFTLAKGNTTNYESMIELLIKAEYKRCDIVEDVGFFAVRGGIIDVYPWTYDDPVRIEFFGDVVESMRTFNVISQRSINEIGELDILPFLKSEGDLQDIFSYLPQESLVVLEDKDKIKNDASEFSLQVKLNYQKNVNNNIYPPTPDEKYLNWGQLEFKMRNYPIIEFGIIFNRNLASYSFKSSPPLTFAGNLNRLFSYLKKVNHQKSSIIIQCDSNQQAERLFEILEDEGLEEKTRISIPSLHNGFIFPEVNVQVLTDHEIFDRFKRRHTYKRFKNGEYLRSLNALNLYDYVVHIDYGIGQYLGLETIKSGKTKRECIKLIYADGDTLFVSVDRLNRVQKYSSENDIIPKLTKLGSGDWEKIKKRTKESISKIAAELIQIEAARKIHESYSFSQDTHWQRELEASFPFEETEDQQRSINEVKKDLEQKTPMNRLLCGDVGYGKTEVALRAAFKVIMDGKQVALLVPTTILAFQHFQTFKERLSLFPVYLEMLSRFRSGKAQKEIISRLEKGDIDIIIGTHRLLSDDVKFKDLGLLIIDEEQRFGVTHKEVLKRKRTTIDILTMTATPIPRTLHLALMGARELSHIETPPRNRLPVITEILEWDDDIIMQAVIKEIDRGGQVYFVHNRVQTIGGIKRILEELVPGAKIAVAHGQLPEKQLEKIMLEFINKKYDILVSTMIIENGLDIPNVNTIIINNADKFGLAQLYQLRGRVGRSKEQAYAYLLVTHSYHLTNLAQKRLRAIQDFTDLGSGFKVALRDLEIRGIGNILGKEQSGNIQSIGFDLYCKILDQSVRRLKAELDNVKIGGEYEHYTDPKIDVDFDLIIPQEYIFSEAERVSIYHRLVNFLTLEEIEKVKEELLDRFGPVPNAVINLIDIIEMKILAGKMLASRIILKNGFLKIHFDPLIKSEEKFFTHTLPDLMYQKKSNTRFVGDQNNPILELTLSGNSRDEQISFAKKLLKSII